MNRPFVRALLAPAAVAVSIALAGCNADNVVVPNGRAMAPLSDQMAAEIEAKHMDKDSPILVRLFKEESEFEVWKKNRDGQFALLKTYPICKWSGDLGPKKKEGDRQAPEGFYTITPGQMNPNSSYYLAFNTGFPNTYDRVHGYTGSELMVHGDCSSRGCYAMTDEQIQEIYALARESFFGGQKEFQLQAYPFRMTAMNMARHRDNPNFAFWKMIKEGYDDFEATRQEPKVAVCDKHYVFDAAADDPSKALKFDPRGKCPAYRLDPAIADAVLEHRQQEQTRMAEYISRGVSTVPSRAGVDGGTNPVFLAKAGLLSNPFESNTQQATYQVAGFSQAPGSLPRVPNPPGTTEKFRARVQQATAAEKQPVVLRGSNTELAAKPKQATPVRTASALPSHPAALAKPTMVVTHTAPPASARPTTVVTHTAPPAPIRQARRTEAPQIRTAYSAPAPSNGLLAGAQPVVPAGSFENRWAAFR